MIVSSVEQDNVYLDPCGNRMDSESKNYKCENLTPITHPEVNHLVLECEVSLCYE